MSAAPHNKPKQSTFAALRYITPDNQPVSPIAPPTTPHVKANKPAKLSLVMPKPDARGPGSLCSPTPSLSPSSPRMSYAQAAGVFSVPATPTTPPPTTPKSINSHTRIGDAFFSDGADWTKDMSGSPCSPTPSLSPSSPKMSYAQAAGVLLGPTTPSTPSPNTHRPLDSHPLNGSAFILNGQANTVDMKGSHAKVIGRHEAIRKTKQRVEIPTIILHRPNGTSTIVNPSFSFLLNPPRMKAGGSGRKNVKPSDDRGDKMLLSPYDARWPPVRFLRQPVRTQVSLHPIWGLPKISFLPADRSDQSKAKDIVQPKKGAILQK